MALASGTLAAVLEYVCDGFHSGLWRALGYESHAREQVLEDSLVNEAMKTEVITITPETPLRDAASVMPRA